jgi:shikimate kinase
MGAGKTEVGKILAERIGYSFADTDSLIQKIAGLTVSEIFHNRGESSFRALESAVIQKMIPDSHGYVFSLGGGALLDRENARLVKERCHIVWIWASVRTIQNRVYSLQRPLLPADRSLEQIERMLEERIPLYSEVCDFVINNELHDAVETADRIKYEMDKAFEN